MKSLIIYDSQYGNTARVAEAIGRAIGNCKVLKVTAVDPSELQDLELLFVGSPTHAGRPTPAIVSLLKNIPTGGLKGTSVTAFDTRFTAANRNAAMRVLFLILGFAGPRIAAELKGLGGELIAPAVGFIVDANEGPLRQGELEHAVDWARHVQQSFEQVTFREASWADLGREAFQGSQCEVSGTQGSSMAWR